MYTKGKFVIGSVVSNLSTLNEIAILVPETVPHTALRPMFCDIVSAGFFHLDAKGEEVDVKVYGESVGLKVKARADEKDVLAIKRAIGEDRSYGML